MILLTKKEKLEKQRKYIVFNTWIEWVSYNDNDGAFEVSLKNLKPNKKILDEKEEAQFDYVIVACGHFNYPNYVTYPGEETFPGKVIHSKFFVDAKRYKGILGLKSQLIFDEKRIFISVSLNYSCEGKSFLFNKKRK